jgi:RNA polymerase sigma factor (sigma-70 family)
LHLIAADPDTWLPFVRRVIRLNFPSGFSPPVERKEVEQECFIKIPEIIAKHDGGAALDSYAEKAVRNDAIDYCRKMRSRSRQSPFEGAADTFGGDFHRPFLDSNGRRHKNSQPSDGESWLAAGWIATQPLSDEEHGSITDEVLESVRRVLAPKQYALYVCRELLGMTQGPAADYLRTTENGVKSLQRKIDANLRKAGLPECRYPNASPKSVRSKERKHSAKDNRQ